MKLLLLPSLLFFASCDTAALKKSALEKEQELASMRQEKAKLDADLTEQNKRVFYLRKELEEFGRTDVVKMQEEVSKLKIEFDAISLALESQNQELDAKRKKLEDYKNSYLKP